MSDHPFVPPVRCDASSARPPSQIETVFRLLEDTGGHGVHAEWLMDHCAPHDGEPMGREWL